MYRGGSSIRIGGNISRADCWHHGLAAMFCDEISSVNERPFDAITEFIFVADAVSKADIVFVAGGSRRQLVDHAVSLYHQGITDFILPSGGHNDRIPTAETEWEYLCQIALSARVPESAILREDRARNTFENARFSRMALEERGMAIRKAVLVCKAHHARRALLTYKTEFPGAHIMVSPITDERDITSENWMTDQTKVEVVMGELEKIGKYFGSHIVRWTR